MKLQYKLLFIVVALVGLSSCNDFLETVPDTRVYLQNLDQLEQLMVSGYADNSYTVLGELSSLLTLRASVITTRPLTVTMSSFIAGKMSI